MLLSRGFSVAQQPSDRGIGGTGMAPEGRDKPPSDRGIGGTGVIGTIQRFGSIYVNNLRIAYRKNASVTIDDVPATASALRQGQVVRVIAEGRQTNLATNHIAVVHEVVGSVESVSAGRLRVLGQEVSTASIRAQRWRVGRRVAVSGIRRPDGVVVASRVDAAAPGAQDRVLGVVSKGVDGALYIGGQRLESVHEWLVGHRAIIVGVPVGSAFVAQSSLSEMSLLTVPGLRVSIETIVARTGNRLAVDRDLRVSAQQLSAQISDSRVARAFVVGTVRNDRSVAIDSVRVQAPSANDPGLSAPAPNGIPNMPLPGGPGPSLPGGGPAMPNNGGPPNSPRGYGPGTPGDIRGPGSGGPSIMPGPGGGFGGPGGGFGGPGGGFGGPGGGPGGPGGRR